MPGLKQLQRFANDIDQLGNESSRRAEKNETLPKLEFPTNISEADDSEEFIFGLPSQKSATDNTNIESSNTNAEENLVSEEIDIEALLAAAANESKEKETLPESDFSIPGIDDNFDFSDLDSFGAFDDFDSSEQKKDTEDFLSSTKAEVIEELPATNIEAIDFTPEGLEEISEPLDLGAFESSTLDSEENGLQELEEEIPNFEDGDLQDLDSPIPDFAADFAANITSENEEYVPEITGDFEIPTLDTNSFDFDANLESENLSADLDNALETFENPDFSIDDINSPISEIDSSVENQEMDFSVPDFETNFSIPDFDSEDNSNISSIDTLESISAEDDFSVPDFSVENFSTPEESFNPPDFSENIENIPIPETSTDDSFSTEEMDLSIDLGSENSEDSFSMPDFSGDDFSMPDFTAEAEPQVEEDFSAAFEDVDLSPAGFDTDNFSPMGNEENPESHDDFDSSFSDFDLVPPEVPQEQKKRGLGFSSGKGKKEEELSTELTEEQYKIFLENLNYYPLNLKVAIEEMIVGNEFNDDVVMDIIHKIIKKVPARQLATQVEKLVDKSIPVPLNYEKRTVAEYEAYRQSFEYNLKNKILPLTFASIIVVGFCILFGFLTAKFVVRPVKANMLYKEGYTLIENGLYPQSESKFNEAVSYHSVKKWHFKYARAYVENKQYERASSMYERLLYNFNFDLGAGLEYGTMELEERSNYEKAEEIVRRYILDHHINSPEGLLLLGDIFLEWATNRDESKFEDARVQYANLIQMFGQQPIYMSRMMRYFIRTDNLAEVLQLKEYFYPKLKKDILEPKDIVELSGYMLDKFYGELPAKDEYLRGAIEDIRELLELAVTKAPEIPESMYNYGRYFVETGAKVNATNILQEALNRFANTAKKTQNRLIAEIDTYRLLGELSVEDLDYLKAEDYFVEGVTLFERERDNSNLRSDKKVGLLYSDLADIDYFISGNFDAALSNYSSAINNFNDTPSIRYRVGYIQYSKDNYVEALGSFIKAVNDKPSDKYLLLALGNTLTLRNSTSAAQGYYEKLIGLLDLQRNQSGVLRPQTNNVDGDLVELYMKAANNLGVVLSLRADQTGNGNLLPKAMANYEESIRAFDALTRNQETMIRLDASNLAAFNQKYLTYKHQDYEPSIYTEISPILEGEKVPEKSVVK